MIRSFADKKTEDVFLGKTPKGFPPQLIKRTRDILTRIEAASEVQDLRFPPSHRLHMLEGVLAGYWSVSVNMQYRIVFRFEGNDALDVRFCDYH
ncbi:type II toxin-antitoxin system RelE/ParE family toxin [Oceanicaulis alexandrii]|uniref:type II toxin-antitoxin system RelE/ParE family toxin n=1 Tax=Oceanicaulis alexandrii TaxID=153233 RepID=UPI0035CF67AF